MSIIKYLDEIIGGNGVLTLDNSVIVSGAGISIDSCLPSGYSLIDRIYKDFNLDELGEFYEKDFQKIVSKLYSNAANEFFSQPRLEVVFNGISEVLSPDEYRNYIFDVFLQDVNLRHQRISESLTRYSIAPNYNHFLLAEFIHQGGTCLTFNFDELIECAYKNLYDQELKVISFPLNDAVDKDDSARERIYKLHGTFHNNDLINVGIDTRSLHINGFPDKDSELLSSILESKQNLIFIGYSVSDSLDFLPFLSSYSRKGRKFNVVFLKFDPKQTMNPAVSILRDFSNSSTPCDYFQIDYYLKKIIADLYIINYFPDHSLKPLIQLPEQIHECSYQVDDSLKSGYRSQRSRIVKLRLLETLGLLNRFGKEELNQISALPKTDPLYADYLHYDFYKKNIEGHYGDNVLYTLKLFLKKPSLRDYNSLFGILNEYVFLTKLDKSIIIRPFALLILLLMWVTILVIDKFLTVKNKLSHEMSPNTASTKRHTYLPLFRVLRGINMVFHDRIFTKVFGKWLLKRINQSKKASIAVNDLKLYRFIEKERLRMEYMLNGKSPELLKQLLDLVTLNIDTNYFVDIVNLFRFKFEITGSEEDRLLCLELIKSTEDKLNRGKIS